MKRYLEIGNFAITEGAILAGCRFFAGYPITPATELAEAMSRRLPQEGGVYLQAEDECAYEAFVLASTLQNPLLIGELGGNIPYGFDLTNSPEQVASSKILAAPSYSSQLLAASCSRTPRVLRPFT